MALSKPVKILVGIATFWYAVYLLLMIVGVVVLLGYVFVALLVGGESLADLRTLLIQILALEFMLPVHVCSLFLEIGLLIFYVVHTIKNTAASDALRIALGLGHLFLPFVAMPIYYYLYIWKENPPGWGRAKGRQIDHLAENVV